MATSRCSLADCGQAGTSVHWLALRKMSPLLISLALLCATPSSARPEDVLPPTVDTNGTSNTPSSTSSILQSDDNTTAVKPTAGGELELERLDVTGIVRHRYATIQVHGKMVNHGDTAEESHFVVHLPDSAFVSQATLEIDGRRMDGEVRERKTAQKEYQQAVNAGLSAGHVFNIRDSNHVRVSVNVPPGARANFNLTYEELLIRRKGRYEIILNLSPDHPAKNVAVDMKLRESSNITFVRVPPFESSLNPDGNDDNRENTAVNVTWPEEEDNLTKARVQYESKGNQEALPGPLVIRYDVDHSASGGEVLLMDGYFVHFLATNPERDSIEPIPKHAIFVLDSSGSMWGRKLQQLKDAMAHILGQLRRQDVFTIVTFSTSATEWSTSGLEPAAGKGVYVATRRNIALAQDFINRMEATGATNIQSALERALILAAKYRNATLAPGTSKGANYTTTTTTVSPSNVKKTAQPVLMFLTDGMPTAGELRLNRILNVVKFLNQIPKANIFSLAFGDGANLKFLRKLALQNSGFSRRIYEAADSALQLQSFYQEIATPLLTNVNFTYVDSKVNLSSVTERRFPTYFEGSELVVAGKLQPTTLAEFGSNAWNELPSPSFSVLGHVTAQTASEILDDIFTPLAILERSKNEQSIKKRRPGHLERAWAYLTVKQLLDTIVLEQSPDEESEKNMITAPTPSPVATDSKVKSIALALSLKYGFVTPLTSLILVERNVDSGSPKEAIIELEGNNIESSLGNGMSAQDKVIPSVKPLIVGGRPRPRPAIPLPPAIISTIISTTTTSQPGATSSWIDSLPWLRDRLQFDDLLIITIDNAMFNRTVVRDLSTAHIENQQDPSSSCILSPDVSGMCRHLVSCHAHLTSYEMFVSRFCDIAGKYVGVCCTS